ncbi:MAG: hypothetical protein WAK82_12860 [Streptosporangiaceae bacterium]
MDPELAEALAPVLRDLANTGAPSPVIEEEQWSDVEGQLTAMLRRPDHTGQGVFVMAGEPRLGQVAAVADQVQEWVVETQWLEGQPVAWPVCPEHPDSHPLAARRTEDRAVWACPQSGNLICDIGRLTGGATGAARRGRRGHRR